ncbi:uncharacterized protein LOC127833650 [Dreissena polymorpha]|uniref:uncharacterized protein LOC127833650 n=1 Tax=Dreissena polymorpha TaxID=45954 RepID=UPI0022646B55|nr:uncharacterized protein LOC127833650 [Dreissena polymorpha]
MENCTFNNESSATYSDASSVATDTNNSTVWKRLYNSYRYSRTKREVSKATMYSDDYVRVNVTIDQDKDVIKNFEIRDSLLVNMGLWRTRICVPDTMGCVQLYPSQASEIFSRMPSLLALQGSLDSCRLLQLLSLTVTFLTFVLLSNTQLRSVLQRWTAIILLNAFLAGFFCIASVMLAITSYALFVPFNDVIVPRFPWAIMFATIAGIVQMYTVYLSSEYNKQNNQIWRKCDVLYV